MRHPPTKTFDGGARPTANRAAVSSYITRWSRACKEPAPESVECRESGDITPQNQRVDIEGAFIGIDGFEIEHVTYDRVLVDDTVSAQHIARHAGDLQGRPHVVTLGEGNLLLAHLALIFKVSQTQADHLRLGDFGQHRDQLVLHQLIAGELTAELLA